jgi:hypothetical protein
MAYSLRNPQHTRDTFAIPQEEEYQQLVMHVSGYTTKIFNGEMEEMEKKIYNKLMDQEEARVKRRRRVSLKRETIADLHQKRAASKAAVFREEAQLWISKACR